MAATTTRRTVGGTYRGDTMGKTFDALKAALAVTTAVGAFAVASGTAEAGGFAIREQSAQFQGSSFAGNAAGGGLSSMYWNPAALGQAGAGLNSESHAALIFGQAVNTVETYTTGPAFPDPPGPGALMLAPAGSGGISDWALVPASYYSYRLSDRLVLGMSMNSGFGLTTNPTNQTYLGAELGRKTKLFTINAAPTLAFKIAPGITIGAGVQIQYASAKMSFATGLPLGTTTNFRNAEDFAFGATAGVLFEPAPGTSIGLGYRSQLSHEFKGDFRSPLVPGGGPVGATTEVNLPDIVTVSLRQSIAPNMRLLGTVEWSNWSRFKELALALPGGTTLHIPANWSDGWFFSVGGEYDLNPGMTLRAGVAYEISPVDDPTKRFTSIPDNDRIWLSAGATLQLTETMSADLAYSHVFIENGDFDRDSLAGNHITGYSEASVDIVTASLKMKWGGGREAEPLK